MKSMKWLLSNCFHLFEAKLIKNCVLNYISTFLIVLTVCYALFFILLVYLQINTWAFPYWPDYHPETLILAQDAVEGQYGSRDDNQVNMEMPMYQTIYYILPTSRKETPILAWDEVEAHVGPGQDGPRYGNDLVVIQ
jgi:hypothetical protein